MENLSMLIDQIAKEKGVKRQIVIKAVEKAYSSIARKKINGIAKVEAIFDGTDNSIQIFKFKKVVDTVKSTELEIALNDAKSIADDPELGDEVGLNITETIKYTRNDISNLRHIIISLINNENKNLLITEYSNKLLKLVSGVVKKVDENHLLIDLGKTEAVLHKTHLIGDETFRVHDKIQAVLMEVTSTPQGAELRLSRKHHLFAYQLLKKEIPEIEDGTIVINTMARVAGKRTHIVVSSETLTDQKILQAILGTNGYKIQNVCNQMNGESIKIIVDSTDFNNVLAQLLKPISPNNVINDKEVLTLVVDDKDVGKVIGSKGYNLTLIASTLEKKVELLTDTAYREYNSKVKNALEAAGFDENTVLLTMANVLVHKPSLTISEIKKVTQFSEEIASNIKIALNDIIKVTYKKVESFSLPRFFDLMENPNDSESIRKEADQKLRQQIREELNLK